MASNKIVQFETYSNKEMEGECSTGGTHSEEEFTIQGQRSGTRVQGQSVSGTEVQGQVSSIGELRKSDVPLLEESTLSPKREIMVSATSGMERVGRLQETSLRKVNGKSTGIGTCKRIWESVEKIQDKVEEIQEFKVQETFICKMKENNISPGSGESGKSEKFNDVSEGSEDFINIETKEEEFPPHKRMKMLRRPYEEATCKEKPFIRQYSQFLVGRKFVVRTNHTPSS